MRRAEQRRGRGGAGAYGRAMMMVVRGRDGPRVDHKRPKDNCCVVHVQSLEVKLQVYGSSCEFDYMNRWLIWPKVPAIGERLPSYLCNFQPAENQHLILAEFQPAKICPKSS